MPLAGNPQGDTDNLFLRDLLQPGGTFISKTVCLGGKGFYFPILIGAMQLVGKAPYVNILRAAELDAMMKDAGFEIVEATDIPTGKPNHFVVARKA